MRAAALFLYLAGLWNLAGCVERELFIQSEPPGAVVCIDGEDRGKTPLSLPFHHYGGRLLELRLKDHKALRTFIEVDPPWYQVFPLDFFSDLLWPETVWDTHVFFYKLASHDPEDLAEEPALLERAGALRYNTFVNQE